jgi:predicted transcriptional regulator
MNEFKIRVESSDDFFERAQRAAKRIDAGDYSTREFGLSFVTPQLLFELLNANRWQLLSTLQRHGAWSIRALAGALARDYKAVHTDVTKLIEAGLIERDEKGLISVPWTRITAELGEEAA